jgi:hypothetical protein
MSLADRRLGPPGETPPDPMLAALIAKLPAAGSLWPAKKRAAWLQLLWLTFDVVYELEAGDVLELPAFLRPAGAAHAAPAETERPAMPEVAPKPKYAFLIDREGFARRGTGERVMPGHVNDVLFDQRGESGDLAAITWADDSRGVRGLTLDISPAT